MLTGTSNPVMKKADDKVNNQNAAVETADIILVRSNPLDVLSIIKLAKAT